MRLYIALLLLLAGCATQQTTGGATTQAQSLCQFTAADLDAAIALAVSAGDTVASNCYVAVKTEITAVCGLSVPAGATGAVSTFEAARLAAARARGLISPQVHIACAPLVSDPSGTLSGLTGLKQTPTMVLNPATVVTSPAH